VKKILRATLAAYDTRRPSLAAYDTRPPHPGGVRHPPAPPWRRTTPNPAVAMSYAATLAKADVVCRHPHWAGCRLPGYDTRQLHPGGVRHPIERERRRMPPPSPKTDVVCRHPHWAGCRLAAYDRPPERGGVRHRAAPPWRHTTHHRAGAPSDAATLAQGW